MISRCFIIHSNKNFLFILILTMSKKSTKILLPSFSRSCLLCSSEGGALLDAATKHNTTVSFVDCPSDPDRRAVQSLPLLISSNCLYSWKNSNSTTFLCHCEFSTLFITIFLCLPTGFVSSPKAVHYYL